MKAIEFISNKNDGVINVPEQYKELLTQEFRVIILLNEQELVEKSSKKTKQFNAIEITTKDFNFNRDEANER